MTDTDGQNRQNTAAASFYALLSHLFLKEPTPDEIVEFSVGELGRHLRELGYDLFEGIGDKSADQQAEVIALEYCRLFVGPGPHLSPHEAILRGEKRHWGEHTVAVNAAYQNAGFEMAPEVLEMPDHVGVELAFAAMLCQREAEHIERGETQGAERLRAVRMRFLEDHLAAWLPDLAEQVAHRAELSFYKTLSKIAADWIANELADATA